MENALEITGLYKQYEGFALRDVTFTLPSGCVMGFIGENGAGKTHNDQSNPQPDSPRCGQHSRVGAG